MPRIGSHTLQRAALTFVSVLALVALAPNAAIAQAEDEVSDRQLLEDFIHFVIIANDEMALANAQALIDRGITDREFVGMVEDSSSLAERFDRAQRSALVRPALEGVAAELGRLYREGRLSAAREPGEVSRNISALTGPKRGQVLATERLLFASEYAVPQLLTVLLEKRDPHLEVEVQSVLVSMGKGSIAPLSAALLEVDPGTQEVLAKILGRIPYRASLPYLEELYQTTDVEAVQAAAAVAIKNISGRDGGTGFPVASLYYELGEQYYSESPSLTTFPDEEHQLLWTFDPGIGLEPTAIRTEVFHEARAMELAERALELDPRNEQAVALWLSSNFSRSIDQDPGYDNPVYDDSRRSAEYYAVAAGPSLMQRVLARGLRDRDTPLTRAAIAALDKSAGDAGLRSALGNQQPLIDALGYPDRRVQYEAALALGRANPASSFTGAERVVPTLANAIRDASSRYAVVVARNIERQQDIRKALEESGYVVLPPVGSLVDASVSIAEAPGVDLVVSDLTGDATADLLLEVRSIPRLEATPVLVLLSTSAIARVGGALEADKLVRVGREGINSSQLQEAARQLVERVSGAPVSDEEAREYSLASLDVLRDLAISGTNVLEVADATSPLLVSLNETDGEIRLRVADVLSYIGQQRAQVALMDAAMDADGDEQLELLVRTTDSAKRFGNLLERRQVSWLMDTVRNGDSEQAETAAALAGALNLASEEIVPLIMND